MMSSPSKQPYCVGGLPVTVHTASNSAQSTKPVFVLFFLHGRLGKAENLTSSVETLFQDIAQANLAQDLYVVTFDHRNHGHRLVEANANNGWDSDDAKSNHRHAIDMYAIQEGSSRDVSFLVDYLPAYLFPESERTIFGWGLAGISLGGHTTWLTLAKDPRVTVGIPIIGCPDYLTLMSARAEKFGISLDSNKFFPESLLALIRESDPAAIGYMSEDETNPFLGKKILVLSGASDTLVPWSASEGFVEALHVGSKGLKKVVLQPETGHAFSPEMLSEMSKFLREDVLSK